MARHKKALLNVADEPSLDISSLIDVCFLLLIYFLATMTIVPRETDLALMLPGPGDSTNSPPIPPLIIRVAADGAIFAGIGVGETPLDAGPGGREVPLLMGQLELYASAARSAGDEPMVMLRVDGESQQQRVIDVLNALGEVKISSVTFEDLIDSQS
ncbi:MAG: biopolymer transporter ExbD [Akkermansiaceae bacterium]|jgi:biopolymer transport protein ExbD|nr:biopolymer transporter ExbD [Akkermansiaceae bacterium]MDP4647840.1 biopolymer transporter ExbD [Akkermansiaceae bacterium]MDP4722054.1 biopolymer transporter ExbD [Akkermansiaceae bacterium]MDP4779085.1 biopolymer transporter ExbD [Akkermansiaceae bacterium]MDP4845942.1 biopolymer transporter ExbD [Akkermansiaceae bacterium]